MGDRWVKGRSTDRPGIVRAVAGIYQEIAAELIGEAAGEAR